MNNEFLFDTIEDLLLFLKKNSESNLLTEICGFVGKVKNRFLYRQMQNRSKDPNIYFIIDPFDHLSFIKDNEVLLVFHSHLYGDENPSEFDLKTSENCCFPFLIYSVTTEKFSIYEPQYKDYDVNIIRRLKELI
jgi:proteasome lid subunit RPN8/RPN11